MTRAGIRRGLVLGKFLPYHAGHAQLIATARAHVDELVVLVCALAREPIPGLVRHAWVAASHPDCHVVLVREEVPQAPEEHPDFWSIWADLIQRHAGAVDAVFTSEAYGDALARQINARHVCVDRARRVVPISATAIRRDPMGSWRWIPPVVRPSYVQRVAILGAESTGKTTMAQQLAATWHTAWVPEYGRAYCEGRDPRQLTVADFEAIARGQVDAEEAAARQADRVLICDTDIRTTATWSELVLGSRSPWLAQVAAARRYAHAILLLDDVPWVNDGTRVLREQRTHHTALLERALEASGQVYTRVGGGFDERRSTCVRIIEEVLRSPVPPEFHVAAS